MSSKEGLADEVYFSVEISSFYIFLLILGVTSYHRNVAVSEVFDNFEIEAFLFDIYGVEFSDTHLFIWFF